MNIAIDRDRIESSPVQCSLRGEWTVISVKKKILLNSFAPALDHLRRGFFLSGRAVLPAVIRAQSLAIIDGDIVISYPVHVHSVRGGQFAIIQTFAPAAHPTGVAGASF